VAPFPSSTVKTHLFIWPLLVLALIAGCKPQSPSAMEELPPDTMAPEVSTYDGPMLSGKYTVVLKTSEGDITIELDADVAPKTVTNFIQLANEGYYDNLTFHRVIPDFMIQGGDPTDNGTGGRSIYGEKFEDEINADSYGLQDEVLDAVKHNGGEPLPPELEGKTIKDVYTMQGYIYNDSLQSLPMERGALAMANAGPNTNGSQFFIIQRAEGTPWLEGRHTVFGRVTEGMDIVDAITAVERDAGDKPLEPVTFTVEVQ